MQQHGAVSNETTTAASDRQSFLLLFFQKRRLSCLVITQRAALYWAPEPADPLTQAGNLWLGRDPERGTPMSQPPLAGLPEATAAPRLYGFHATLRPPMRLSTGWPEFIQAAHRIAESVPSFDLPTLQVADMDGFLALREMAHSPLLQNLADACVRGTDRHRLRPDPAELARRRASGLSPRQDEMLLQWGYPYVFSEWRFHMTLTRRLDSAEMARLLPAAQAHFAEALALPRRVESLTVFTQRAGQAFLIAERIALRREVGAA